MKIKDQIRTRREQLGISIDELGRRVGVSHQAVRHWESGRSFPGKAKAPNLEDALSFRLDWTEGVKSRLERPDVAALLDEEDVEILLAIRKLPESVKKIIVNFTQAYIEALDGRAAFMEKIRETPVGAFTIRESDGKKTVTGNGADIKRSPARKSSQARKRVA